MAKTISHEIDIRDVVKVHHLYNKVWRKHVKFPTADSEWEGEPRYSDHDLWKQGLPALTQRGTIGDGYTELQFTFQDSTERDADNWVRAFIHDNRLPSTYYKVQPSKNLKGLITYRPGERIPNYVRVIVRFEEDEVFNSRARSLREARYFDPLSVENVTAMYKDGLAPYISSEMYRQGDEPNTKLELGGYPVRVSNVNHTIPHELDDASTLEYCMSAFLFYANDVTIDEAKTLVKEFMKSLKLPVTSTPHEYEHSRYDEDIIKIYKPIRVYAVYNPRARS